MIRERHAARRHKRRQQYVRCIRKRAGNEDVAKTAVRVNAVKPLTLGNEAARKVAKNRTHDYKAGNIAQDFADPRDDNSRDEAENKAVDD